MREVTKEDFNTRFVSPPELRNKNLFFKGKRRSEERKREKVYHFSQKSVK